MGDTVTGTVPHFRDTAQARRHGDARPGLSPPLQALSMMSPDQKRANVRLALILASVALVFMLGIVAKMAFFAG